MTERLRRTWDELLHRARAWEAEADPGVVAEAYGYALVHALLDEVALLPEEDRRFLATLAGAVSARVRALALAEPDARDDYLDLVAVVEAGARALSGNPIDLAAVPADLSRPTPRRLQAMMRGELDGLSAASAAAWYLRNDPAEPRLFHRLDGARPARTSDRVLLAADAKKPVRSPTGGQRLGTLEDLRVEAVWFPADRQLALYCADDAPVRVAARGLATIDVQPGYWLGQWGGEGAREVELEVRVGEVVRAWRVELAAE